MSDGRKYVGAHVIHYEDGSCCPTVIEVDGRAYLIQRIFERRDMSPGNSVNASEYFAVEVMGKERFLFRDGQRWFVIPGLVRNSSRKNSRQKQ